MARKLAVYQADGTACLQLKQNTPMEYFASEAGKSRIARFFNYSSYTYLLSDS